jgi:ribosomal protein S18 acetylase RimI-like enzyme
MTIAVLTAESVARDIGQLAELLVDAVESGASVGFLPPLSRDEALGYWRSVVDQARAGSRVLLAAIEDGVVQGSVQLALETRANGNHRAEACKLFVHRRARRRGLARLLMVEAEAEARRRGITLLLMDTRKGGEAEKLCDVLGYTKYGEVPAYARSADGTLHTTSFYYRELA